MDKQEKQKKKLSVLVISTPSRYRDSLGVVLSAIPEIDKIKFVDGLQDALLLLGESGWDLVIYDTEQDGVDPHQALVEIKSLNQTCRVLVVADAAIWQLTRNIPEADLVSLKGFSIQHFRAIIDPMVTETPLNGAKSYRISPKDVL